MATPEQAMLAIQQIYGSPFEGAARGYAQANDARTNLAFKLAAMQREEQLKRDLADEQAKREDARNRTTLDWHRARDENALKVEEARGKTADTRQTARDTESDRKQTAALEARDKQQIRATISKDYPTYVDEAENLGEEVRPRREFDDSVEGLGDLQKELGKLRRLRITRDQEDATKPALMRLQQMETDVTAKTKRLEEVRNPSEKDRDLAHLRGVEAVRSVINKGDFGGKKPPSKDQIEKGLAAFDAKELDVAAGFLPGFKPTYDQTYAQMLLAIKNSKSESQDAAIAARDLGDAQKSFNAFSDNVWKAAGGNTKLMKALSERTPLQQMMAPPAPDQRSEEDKLRAKTPPPGGMEPPTKPTSSTPAMGFGGRFTGIPNPPPYTGGGFGFGGVPIAPGASTIPPAPSASPYDLPSGGFGHGIRNMLGLSPLTREGYAYDLEKLNNQLQFQNERGRATTLQELQRLLIRAQTDPALAPGN